MFVSLTLHTSQVFQTLTILEACRTHERFQPNSKQTFVCCRTLPNTTVKPRPNTPGTPNTASNTRLADHAFSKRRTHVQPPLGSPSFFFPTLRPHAAVPVSVCRRWPMCRSAARWSPALKFMYRCRYQSMDWRLLDFSRSRRLSSTPHCTDGAPRRDRPRSLGKGSVTCMRALYVRIYTYIYIYIYVYTYAYIYIYIYIIYIYIYIYMCIHVYVQHPSAPADFREAATRNALLAPYGCGVGRFLQCFKCLFYDSNLVLNYLEQ